MIISISGKIGSGKDTVADIIQSMDISRKWEVKKWAGKLKQVATLLTGIPMEKWEDQEFKKTELGPEWGMTVRDLLQKLGTDALRNGLHENTWVNALMSEYLATTITIGINEWDYWEEDVLPNWIVTDTRFPNEVKAIKEKGGILIKIERDTSNIIGTGHISETALDDYTEWDYVIDNNGSLLDLRMKIKDIFLERRLFVSSH